MKSEATIMQVHNTSIAPGETALVRIPVGRIPSGNLINIQAHIFRSKKPGPTALLLGGVHGDEVNGVEIVRKAIEEQLFTNLKKGTVIAVPVVNVYGFINFSRDVHDGKDINRSFPGNKSGSLASRVSFYLSKKILPLADFGLDFHTGGRSHFNYPQIRYTIGHNESEELGKIFGAPYLLAKKMIPKSLRKHAIDSQIPMLVYEGGENLRLHPFATSQGLLGLKRVLISKGMLSGKNREKQSLHFSKTGWIRSPKAGMFHWVRQSGQKVQKGEVLGYISDAFGLEKHVVLANRDGHIIGHSNLPIVTQGDALFHVAYDPVD